MEPYKLTRLDEFVLEKLLECYGMTRFNKEFYTDGERYHYKINELKDWIKEREIDLNTESYSEVFRILDKDFLRSIALVRS